MLRPAVYAPVFISALGIFWLVRFLILLLRMLTWNPDKHLGPEMERRREFRRLMDERNRLFDQGNNEGGAHAQQELTEWTQQFSPDVVKELERWYAAHSSE